MYDEDFLEYYDDEKLFSSRTDISWTESRKNAWKSVVCGIVQFQVFEFDFDTDIAYYLTSTKTAKTAT